MADKCYGAGKETTKPEKGKPLAPIGQGSMKYDIPKKKGKK